jgi:hypothetical protein
MTPTDWFIVLWLFGVLVYDLWAVFNKRKNDTISHRVRGFCLKRPWFALLLLLFTVLLAGHFLMPDGVWWLWMPPVFVE